MLSIKSLFRRWVTIVFNFTVSIFVYVNTKPLIILGNQKAGTSAIAALLAKASNKSIALDLMNLNEPVISELHTRKLSWEKALRRYLYLDFCNDIVKEPLLTFLYESHLLQNYPKSDFIFIVRHPLHNIRSQLNWIKHSGKAELLNQNNPNLTPLRRRVFSYSDFAGKDMHLIKILAARWNTCAEIYLRNSDKMTLVKYEDFQKDKQGYIYKLAKDIGFEIHTDISASVNVQFQPKGNSEVNLLDFFGSKNYRIIHDFCGSNMRKLGYYQ